jgi:predicted phosphodiesterase
MMSRTIVISDIHFLRRAQSAPEMLSPIFDSCDHLVVNGDLVEYHQEEVIAEAERVIEEMHRLAERHGTRLSLLAGNHDHDISDERAITFAERKIVITHGDAFHTMIAPWARHAPLIRAAWVEARRSQGRDEDDETIEDRFDATRIASIAEWKAEQQTGAHTTLKTMLCRPRIIWRILRYWKESPELARRFGARFYPEATHMITGHSHRQNIDRRRQPTVINTGSFTFPGRPRCVVLEGDALKVLRLKKVDERWRPDWEGHPLLQDEVKNASVESGRQGVGATN